MTGARLLTPPGRGAVAVILIEGEGALVHAIDRLGLPVTEPGRVRLVKPRTEEGVLDEALLVVLSERALELHVHGSPPLVAELIERLGPAPKPSTANLEERAWDRLPHAPCEGAARMLLDQAEGALTRELRRLRDGSRSDCWPGLRALIERGRVARFALRPARVVIAGPVNAGKSTLFNALMAYDRVLVSSEAGTTRDAIFGRVLLGEWPVDLIDTAGERRAAGGESDAVERAGQELARSLREEADLVLRLEPVGGPSDTPEAPEAPEAQGPRQRVFASLADLDPRHRCEAGRLSALQNPQESCALVAQRFRETFALPARVWSPNLGVPFDDALLSSLEGVCHDSQGEGHLKVRDALDSLLREPWLAAPLPAADTIAANPQRQ